MQQRHIDSFSKDEDEMEPTYCNVSEIAGSKYEQQDTDNVVDQFDHLTKLQKQELKQPLRKFPKLFSGKLGLYPHRKIGTTLDPAAKPMRKRHCPVAEAHKKVFKDELDHLVSTGVLKKAGASEWLAPTFLVPKKLLPGETVPRVRWASDFRELNQLIKRKCCPLPKISDVLRRRKGCKCLTKLDISMQHYTFEPDDEAKKILTISTPFGNYEHQRMPMGCCQSSDCAQETMEDVLADVEQTEVYIDDAAAFDDSWHKHLQTLDVVLTRLQSNNFTINPLKCEWCVQETDFLGHWLTPKGIKPWKKKADAMLKSEPPKTIKEARSFTGAVNFCRDMHPKRSHVLEPPHELTGLQDKSRFKWLPKHQKAFEQMKAVMAKEAHLAFPNHDEPFHACTDASDVQLGSVVLQNGRPIAYYSRKLNPAQRNCTTMEKELLSIVETLREFKTMLFGCKELHIHTDHKNLTCANLNSQRAMRWRLFLEEFNPEFHCVPGDKNTFADALSRLPRKEEQEIMAVYASSSPIMTAESFYGSTKHATVGDDRLIGPPREIEHSCSIAIDDDELMGCFINFPEVDRDHPFALDCRTTATAQQNDIVLRQCLQHKPNQHLKADIGEGMHLIAHRETAQSKVKTCTPDSMLDTTVSFCHRVLGHAGCDRTKSAIDMHFKHNKLDATAREHCKCCEPCQICKNPQKSYNMLPARTAGSVPWSDIAVDLIGPWSFRDQDGFEHTFIALTIIDLVTNCVETIRLENKSAQHVAHQFKTQWLARHPRPNSVIFDPGPEFKGEFREMLEQFGITPSPATVKNPQANSTCERLHLTVADIIRPMICENPPKHSLEAAETADTALAAAAYASRTALHATMKMSPGQLAFNRDMPLDVPMHADFQLLRAKRQQLIDRNLERANRKRVSHDYNAGDECLKLAYKPNKLEPRAQGPCTIERIHSNGSATIRISEFTTERINFRRLRPFWTKEVAVPSMACMT